MKKYSKIIIAAFIVFGFISCEQKPAPAENVSTTATKKKPAPAKKANTKKKTKGSPYWAYVAKKASLNKKEIDAMKQVEITFKKKKQTLNKQKKWAGDANKANRDNWLNQKRNLQKSILKGKYNLWLKSHKDYQIIKKKK